jgi:hypothetical protein
LRNRFGSPRRSHSQTRENSMNRFGWPRENLRKRSPAFENTESRENSRNRFGSAPVTLGARIHYSRSRMGTRKRLFTVHSRPLCARNRSLWNHCALEITARARSVATVRSKSLLELAP